MFVGHIALAYAAKRIRPEVSLGWYYAAVSALDLIWPVLLLIGVEHVDLTTRSTIFMGITLSSIPWSHSLIMSLVWGIVLAGLARSFGVTRRAAPLLVALVMSHWVLDYVTHAPDMPLWPGGATYGLALWDHVKATYLIEGAMWVGGIAIYMSVRRPVGWQGWVGFLSFVLVSTALWLPGPSGPVPPDLLTLGLFSLIGGWISIPWIAWGDKHTRAAGSR
jgi:hypothetical protein